jgi:hypothetical protein
MDSKGCKFCRKVGSQPIVNKRTMYNYTLLEVKKKEDKKLAKKKKEKPLPDEPQVQLFESALFEFATFF